MAFHTYGVVTLPYTAASGVADTAVWQLAQQGALERCGKGVYRMTAVRVVR